MSILRRDPVYFCPITDYRGLRLDANELWLHFFKNRAINITVGPISVCMKAAPTYRPYVSETGTVFDSLQIGETRTNLRPPPWTTLGRAPRPVPDKTRGFPGFHPPGLLSLKNSLCALLCASRQAVCTRVVPRKIFKKNGLNPPRFSYFPVDFRCFK